MYIPIYMEDDDDHQIYEYLACAPKAHQQAPADTPHTHTRTLQPAAARVQTTNDHHHHPHNHTHMLDTARVCERMCVYVYLVHRLY
jgi:hypothetical protein